MPRDSCDTWCCLTNDSRRARFHSLSKGSPRIFWILNSQLLLESSILAYLVDDGQIATEPPAEQLCGLAPNTSCLLAREQHYDLDDAANARN